MFAQSSPEQMKAGMEAWQNWLQKCGSAVLDLGAPLDKSTTEIESSVWLITLSSELPPDGKGTLETAYLALGGAPNRE